jgi:hypothetical protein
MDPGTKAGETDKDPKDNFEDITTTPKRKSLETNFQHQDASEKELEGRTRFFLYIIHTWCKI